MNAEIIAVGTELLLGQIVNTNAQYLSQKLSEHAINVYNQSVVGDNVGRLKEAIKSAFSRSDMIIFTGGLGPTKDDLTKETIADYFGLKLVRDEKSLENIVARFKLFKRGEMPKSNEKQADMPEGCIILPNDDGTAPGGIVEKDGKIAIFLPGPPYEMKMMYEHYVEPYLAKKNPQKFYSKIVNIIGMGESYVAEQLDEIMTNQLDPTIAPYATEGEMMLRVTTKASSQEEADEKFEPTLKKIKEVVGDAIYGYDNEPLENVVFNLLKEKNYTLTTAESCTGGLIASIMTNVSGISSYYNEGIITYSNDAKMKYLSVSAETLQKHGAVSENTAIEMAEGARINTNSDISVAVTGIAGPGGGTEDKKVGLVYIAVSDKSETVVEKFQFTGDRQKVRRLAAKNAINMIRKKLLKNL